MNKTVTSSIACIGIGAAMLAGAGVAEATPHHCGHVVSHRHPRVERFRANRQLRIDTRVGIHLTTNVLSHNFSNNTFVLNVTIVKNH